MKLREITKTDILEWLIEYNEYVNEFVWEDFVSSFNIDKEDGKNYYNAVMKGELK